ncbi:MAG: DsbE family thiol:disulfide interchange protein [Neptuniibacter caesariensis]|uniref:DsbE family thiol:disulfide interchange protein n=1 Tax=Neptuniibacter caesariensis TaxID=207954 RepID=A0A2G6JPS0_NEPCE|nr:MAG: DsbE family thiol:disulfide interchange protein [Neptuniibacter caesariensis]
MRRFVLFIPLVLFLGIGFFLWKGLQLDPTELPSALLDKPFPTFELSSLYDEQVTLTEQDILGEAALVNVWATWCPSCKQEHAQLNRIKAEGYTVIGINYKDDRGKAKVWLEKYLDPYAENIFDQKGRLGLDLGVYGAPETYVIDQKGVIRYKHVGVVDERVWAQLKQIIDNLNQGKQVVEQ